MLYDLQIGKLRSLDLIKVSTCNVKYFSVPLSMRPSGSVTTVNSEGDLGNYFF